MTSTSGSGGLPPKKPSINVHKPHETGTTPRSSAGSTENQAGARQPAPKSVSNESAKRDGILSQQAAEGALSYAQIKKPPTSAETAELLKAVVNGKPLFGDLHPSTLAGLTQIAKNHSNKKDDKKYDSLIPDDYDGLKPEEDTLRKVINLAFSG